MSEQNESQFFFYGHFFNREFIGQKALNDDVEKTVSGKASMKFLTRCGLRHYNLSSEKHWSKTKFLHGQTSRSRCVPKWKSSSFCKIKRIRRLLQ